MTEAELFDGSGWHQPVEEWPSYFELGPKTKFPRTRDALLRATTFKELYIIEPWSDDHELCLAIFAVTDKDEEVRFAVWYVDGLYWYGAEGDIAKHGAKIIQNIQEVLNDPDSMFEEEE